MTTVRLLDGILRCAKHDFPMIYIGDGYACVAEYLDWAIGGQAIVDAVEKEDEYGDGYPLTVLVFENGVTMPLYHHRDFVDSDPLLLNRKELLNAIANWRVKGFMYDDNTGLSLRLASNDHQWDIILKGLSLDSVYLLEVPAGEEEQKD